VQEAYAEERKVQEMTPRSEEVQEADDEEWGSANATGGETGECKNAIERGKWGHPSSRHSCDGSVPRNALAPIT
jgi:hypothetical protein